MKFIKSNNFEILRKNKELINYKDYVNIMNFSSGIMIHMILFTPQTLNYVDWINLNRSHFLVLIFLLFINRSLYCICIMQKPVSFEVKLEETEKPESFVLSKPKRKRRKIVESDLSGKEEPYEPDFNQYKKIGLPVDMNRVTTGSWSIQENRIYLHFLMDYKDDFQNENNRRRTTVFNRLSKALKKRTPDQCRSHHQKLQNRFKNNLKQIIKFVQQKLSPKDADLDLTYRPMNSQKCETKTKMDIDILPTDTIEEPPAFICSFQDLESY